MNMRPATLEIDSPSGSKTYMLTPQRANSFEELYVDFQLEPELGGTQCTLFLHPKQDLIVKRLEIQFDFPVDPDARFFANGYQSRSESRLLPATATLPRLRKIARPFIGLYGDEHISGIPRGAGCLHAWTYTYLTRGDGNIQFWGSTNESTGFTLFLYNGSAGLLTVRKDLGNLALSHSFPALEFWTGQGGEAAMFDAYAGVGRIFNSPDDRRELTDDGRIFNSPDDKQELTDDGRIFNSPENVQISSEDRRIKNSPHSNSDLGWTSNGAAISEEIILKNAESIAASGLPFRYLLIDDGWQTAAGDWRSVKPEFPGGMGRLAAQIRDTGLEPGLWLAPFIASGKSKLVRQHPEWLLRDSGGQPLKAGWNWLWGGWYYALNFYHPAVQDYLSGIFHIVLEQWRYAMVKPDFLFAACLAPPSGKTRGQVMHDAMEFLRRQLEKRKMLASGIPLGSAFGVADFCRTGADTHLAWEHRLLHFLRHRERVSTLASLRSTLSRWQMNGRFFRNDPGVFSLHPEGQRLTPVQQNTLLTINALLGGILFTPDDVGAYTPEQRAELEEALALRGSCIETVSELQEDVFRIDFKQEGHPFSAYCNLTKRTLCLTQIKNGQIEIQPFETIILKRE